MSGVAGCANNNPADIVFVLDESGSIWNPDFNKQIQFVKVRYVHGYDYVATTHKLRHTEDNQMSPI